MRVITVVYFFLVAAAVRISAEMYVSYLVVFPIQKYDSYIYLLKALEITRGDWSPIHTHAIGFSVFMAPFLYAWGAHSIFENLLVGIIITAIAGALIVFPLAWLTFKLTQSKKMTAAALCAFIFSFPLMISGNLFILTEPLFTLLFLTALCFIYKARDNPLFAYAASATAGLGYWVRPNGIVILPILLASYYIIRKEAWRIVLLRVIIMTIVFFAVAAPMLFMRYAEFGSVFNYGANSKYFMERYVDVWGATPSVPFTKYLATHTTGDIFSRFFVTGFCLILLYFAYVLLPQLFFFLIGVVTVWRDPLWRPLWIALGIWIMSLVPIFHLYNVTRHLFPIAPLGILISIAGIRALTTKRPESVNAILALFAASQAIILCVSFSAFLVSMRLYVKDIYRINRDSMQWAAWASTHVKGTLAVNDGITIMMLLPDTKIGGRGLQDLEAPLSGLRLTYPGQFNSLEEAMPVLAARKVTHILIDDQIFDPMPLVSNKYLVIYTGEIIPAYFKEVYSNYATRSQGKVRIFKIDWNEYEKKVL